MKRAVISLLVVLTSISPVAAQTAFRFPSTLIISDAALRAGDVAAQAGGQAQPAAPASPPTSSGPRVPLTLEEAVKLALDHNLDIAVARLNPPTFDLSLASLLAVYKPTV